jgi:hypothetical protein
MSWVEEAPGTERVANIVSSHSLNAGAMEAHLELYRTIMFGPSGLSRPEREAIAVCVSAANECHY